MPYYYLLIENSIDDVDDRCSHTERKTFIIVVTFCRRLG
jgi:hypothetical protein